MSSPFPPASGASPLHAHRTLVIVAAVLAALALFLWRYTWGALAGPVARLASHELHRRVQIGHFTLHLLRWTPTVTIDDLRIANAPWARGPYVAQIRSLRTGIVAWQLLRGRLVLSELQIEQPLLDLQRDAQQRENWDFTPSPQAPRTGQPPGPPPHLPPVHLFTMRGGSVRLSDAIRHLQFLGAVVANEHAVHPAQQPLRVRGHGQLNGKPFELNFQGGALFDLQLDQPYEFSATITAGPLAAAVRGEIDRPFDFGHMGATLQIRGQNLAGLYYLTGLALPFTPPFTFESRLRNDGGHFILRDIRASVGQSDLEGSMSVDAERARPLIVAQLHSRSFDLSDLAPSVGAGVSGASGQADLNAPSSNRTAQGLLPTYQFQFDRLRGTDARVRLHADAVKASLPIQSLQLGLQLTAGDLSLDPLELTLTGGGALSGVIRIDAHATPAVTALDLRLRNVDLAQFKPAQAAQAPLQGMLLSRVMLKGQGNSVRDILGSSSGQLTAVVPDGTIRKAFAELTGINVARGLGLLLAGNQQQTPIRCAIAAFAVQRGVGRVQQMVVSTDVVRLTGSGDFDFGDERLNLVLQGHPTHVALFHLEAPIAIGGTFTRPSLGVKPGKLLAQAGAAAALGVLATPAAALLAFVDPGLHGHTNCSALLSLPQADSTEHPGPPHASPQAPAQRPPH